MGALSMVQRWRDGEPQLGGQELEQRHRGVCTRVCTRVCVLETEARGHGEREPQPRTDGRGRRKGEREKVVERAENGTV